MNNITIRLAKKTDLQVLVSYNQKMAKETENKQLDDAVLRQGVANLFDQPQYGFYGVAEFAESIVGQLMITYEWSDWRNGLFWWIQSVYVHPDFRGKGIFRQMYEFILAESSKHPVCGIRLYVDKDNVNAKITYQKCGMAISHYDMYETEFVRG
ncbi:GNAT family N-acetyltransferase [bacterium]|nr:GNAT family N-acetyltransferase [bacterium]